MSKMRVGKMRGRQTDSPAGERAVSAVGACFAFDLASRAFRVHCLDPAGVLIQLELL